METLLIANLFFGLLFGLICYKMAEGRGRSKGLGFVLGLLFGLWAVIGYAIAGNSQQKKQTLWQRRSRSQKRMDRAEGFLLGVVIGIIYVIVVFFLL